MAKSAKIEKETKRLIEAMSDLVKKKGDRYKFRSKKKKLVKKVKKSCVHWVLHKSRPTPTVVHDPERPGYWKCAICGASFPIKPLQGEDGHNAYQDASAKMLELVNQMQFWSVKLGGDADDTKMFLKLKVMLPRFAKTSKQILKHINKRNEFEENRKKQDSMSQFDMYSGFSYR